MLLTPFHLLRGTEASARGGVANGDARLGATWGG